MVNVQVTIKGEEALERSLSKLGSFDFITAAADGVYQYLVEYHQGMDWRGPNWIPSADSGQFAQNVVQGWQPPEIAGDTARIVNTFGLLAWKVTGGTITPKKAGALTIPLTVAAKENPASYFRNLFIAGNTLSLKLGKSIVAQYALKKSVTQVPWPGAMPTDEQITEAALANVISQLPAAA